MTNQKQVPAIVQKDITDQVNSKITVMQNEGLALPASYSHANALKSAFFALTNHSSGNLLEKCSRESIANALLDMVIQGLSPAKTQCYFVPYGGTLKMTRSYFGTMAVVKRLNGVKNIWANVIYDGDDFELEIDEYGKEKLVKHETSFKNRDNAIVGAYAIIETDEDERFLTVMTKKEIDTSWSKAKTKNVQKDFPQEMAKRTVINRAAKAFINTSDDSDLLIESINNTTSNEYENDSANRKEVEIIEEIEENANSEVFEPVKEETKPPKEVTENGEIINEDIEPVETELLPEEETGDPY
ncbi:recombinase RecT [Vagococcus sp. JNUCC 83]